MEEILKILEEIRPEFDFKASSNFIEDGLLDSFDIVTLVNILEEKYQIKIDGLDIIPENFSSAESIFNLVNKNKN
ncbi:MAG: acyl carrier protein [Synergistaceae bacterium]|nr:acyl carrier protein [Synergistaceae bacterium]MBQ3626464.1 acyl carrier protein [Synergistaceae bacterium]MBQ6740421.1 acyl carrier protein [Synergistaceae bacterium]MBQ7570020.1 acyl carrier protein [Synergistaceae bacterium]MBQ9582575.1 acyl carrier protein [Synergistaceae bacterium]